MSPPPNTELETLGLGLRSLCFNLQVILLKLSNTIDVLAPNRHKNDKASSHCSALGPHIVVHTTVPHTEAFHAHSLSQGVWRSPVE